MKPTLTEAESSPDERRADPVNNELYGGRLVQQGLFDDDEADGAGYGDRLMQEGLFEEDENEVDLANQESSQKQCDATIDPPANGRVVCDFQFGVCSLKCDDGFKAVGCKSGTECLCNASGCAWTTLGRNCLCQSERSSLSDR